MNRATLVVSAMLACACAGQPTPPAAELFGTYWRIVQIDGKAIDRRPGTREPHIVLRREGSRVSGFAGCNSLAGGFRHDRDTLSFGNLAMTRMACLGDGDALETAFTRALASTASYRVTGDRLELREAAGAVRMIFESRGPASAVK